jgi:hypothetical protein
VPARKTRTPANRTYAAGTIVSTGNSDARVVT